MVDSKQFIISRTECDKDGYISIHLNNDFFFCCKEDTGFHINPVGNVLLIGYAWQVKEDKKSPERIIDELTGSGIKDYKEKLLTEEESWAGRYVLIIDDCVYLDATGLLGIYYSDYGISSSFKLLEGMLNNPFEIYRSLGRTNWLPGPLTSEKKIKRMLPSQVLHYTSGIIESRDLLKAKENDISDDDRVRLFTDLFRNSLKNLKQLFPNDEFVIPLTGGHDSRTVLALTIYAGIEMKCVTLERDNISSGDKELPELLCKRKNIPYSYIKRDKKQFSDKRVREYEEHTSGYANDEDKRFFAYGQYEKILVPGTKIILLRGHVWESVIEYYEKYLGEKTPEDFMLYYMDAFDNLLVKQSLEEYFKWSKNHPQQELSEANRFMIEQRVGSWMSSIEQGFDLMDGIISFHPVNSRILLSLLLGFSKNDRVTKKHQERIIEYCCPVFKNIDYTGGVSHNEMTKKTLNRITDRIRKMGAINTMKWYLRILNYRWNI